MPTLPVDAPRADGDEVLGDGSEGRVSGATARGLTTLSPPSVCNVVGRKLRHLRDESIVWALL